MNILFNELSFYIFGKSRRFKRFIISSFDIFLCIISVFLSFFLRLGDLSFLSSINNYLNPFLITIYASVLLSVFIFNYFEMYKTILRFSGLGAFSALFNSILSYSLIFIFIFTLIGFNNIPRTIGIIQPILFLFFIIISRLLVRIWIAYLNNVKISKNSLPKVLIYGAGQIGNELANAIANSNVFDLIGFLDDDIKLKGLKLNGLPIYNPIELDYLIKNKLVKIVLLALNSISREDRNKIISKLTSYKLDIRTLPTINDIANGKINLNNSFNLDIYDLLGRDPVKPDDELLKCNVLNKIVLVSGAGGSIGSEICRQLLLNKPNKLLIIDTSEFALYKIHEELVNILAIHINLQSDFPKIEIIPLLTSVCDDIRIKYIIDKWRPDTVFHAAAYKHVPIVEQNPFEGVRNNVWGTYILAKYASLFGVKNFVLVSTDKAVRPTNIMGVSKRIAELIIQAFDSDNQKLDYHNFKDATNKNIKKNHDNKTIFSAVRFGNVLGSSGSVVPLFRKQIKMGGPISLTHPDVTRYFMSITEASQLVIQAGALAKGGEIFILDMGKPILIKELAVRMVELSGLTIKSNTNPYGDIEIKITGLRPGEKLYEELLIDNNSYKTTHPSIFNAYEKFIDWDSLIEFLNILERLLNESNESELKIHLKKMIPEYILNSQVYISDSLPPKT